MSFFRDTLYGSHPQIPLPLHRLIKESSDFPQRLVRPMNTIFAKLNDRSEEFALARFGFIPNWVQSVNHPFISKPLVNAKIESLREGKPSFSAFDLRRCAIPANGWFEWKSQVDTRLPKMKFHIRMKHYDNFFFAGLWDSWDLQGDHEKVVSAAIITCPAEGYLSSIHSRMPIILRPENVEGWLAPEPLSQEECFALLKPLSFTELWPQNLGTNEAEDMFGS